MNNKNASSLFRGALFFFVFCGIVSQLNVLASIDAIQFFDRNSVFSIGSSYSVTFIKYIGFAYIGYIFPVFKIIIFDEYKSCKNNFISKTMLIITIVLGYGMIIAAPMGLLISIGFKELVTKSDLRLALIYSLISLYVLLEHYKLYDASKGVDNWAKVRPLGYDIAMHGMIFFWLFAMVVSFLNNMDDMNALYCDSKTGEQVVYINNSYIFYENGKIKNNSDVELVKGCLCIKK